MANSHPNSKAAEHKDFDTTRRALFRSNLGDLWYAETKLPLSMEEVCSPWCWDVRPRMVCMYVKPVYIPSLMTLARSTSGLYEKRIDLLEQGIGMYQEPWLKDVTGKEIQMCQMLHRYPHPNVCAYHGVTVDDSGHVSSLVFDQYDMDVSELVDRGCSFNASKCVDDISAAILHMHSLGLVHCDVEPSNIFVNLQTGRFVLGDFDSTHWVDTVLATKCGTIGWVPEDGETNNMASYEIDWFSLGMLRAWLAKKGNGRPVEGQIIHGTLRGTKSSLPTSSLCSLGTGTLLT
uniref:Serine/threonine kinase n=1 Tax=Leptosphaeria maculans TaxID=5022 RepID=Q6T417_LEPMC|nr:serine/threonine kinase [Plenodomus lingam]